jgi:SAM-dependent methyltransferase
MEPGEYRRMFELEDRYWWFLAKRALVRMLIERHVATWPPSLAVDVGCGTGGTLAALSAAGGTWIGMDRSELALAFCRERRLSGLTQASAEAIPLTSGCADLLLCLDVLYHRNVGDEEAVLAECFRVMAPHGSAIITDSALNWLRGPHDEAVHTRRRYRLGELSVMVQRAGFEIVRRTYANSLLLAPLVAHRLARRLVPGSGLGSDVVDVSPGVNRMLSTVQACERWLLRRVSMPIGTTVVIVARKA